MRIWKCTKVDGQSTFGQPVEVIAAGVEHGGGLAQFSADERITEQQRKWFKGVLLPALADDTGDSKASLESELKLAVMPDKFAPDHITVKTIDSDGNPAYLDLSIVPSITILTKKQMGELIEGSVAHLRASGFDWVTLPDPELRSARYGCDCIQ